MASDQYPETARIAHRTALRGALYAAVNFFAPILMLALVCLWNGVHPFGDQSFLTEDLKFQYIDFYTWFKGVLEGANNPMYSSAQGLGGNAWGLLSYYLSSPFNLLVVFFDEAHLTDFCVLATALKLGCIQLAAAFFLRRRFELPQAPAALLAFGFTWSSWTATMLRNPMWLDALILLPVAMYATYALVRRNAWRLLTACLALMVATCWYTAYMCFLFLALYAVFELVVARCEGMRVAPRDVVGKALRFVGAVALALALAAWTFVPTVLAMGGATRVTEATGFFNCPPIEVASGLFAANYTPGKNIPQLYVGTLALALAAAFFAARGVPRGVKAAAGAFFLVMVASCWIVPLYCVWCGFRLPNGFYCRISFFAGALLVWMAAYFLHAVAAGRCPRPCRSLAVGGVAAFLFAAVVALAGGFERIRYACMALALIVWYTALCMPLLPRSGGTRAPAAGRPHEGAVRGIALCAVALALFAELLYSAHVDWAPLYTGYPQASHDAYMEGSRTQADDVRADSDQPYRMEKTYSRTGITTNEGLSLGIRQLSIYSSSYSIEAVSLLESLGYSQMGTIWVRYASPILASDALLGVRYISSVEQPAGLVATDLAGQTTLEGLAASVYENPYALPLGYGVAMSALDAVLPAGGDPFVCQNAFASSLLGTEVAWFAPLEATLVEDGPEAQTWEVEVPAGCIGYVYALPALSTPGCTIAIAADVAAEDFDPTAARRYTVWGWRHTVETVADAQGASEPVTCTVSLRKDQVDLADDASCLFYAFDVEAFADDMERLADDTVAFTRFEDGVVEGTYRSDGDGIVLMTIPNDGGWRVTVNGSPVEPLDVYGGALMAIPVEAGENLIEMRFTAPGLAAGCAVTACALVGLAVAGLRGAYVRRRSVRQA